MSADDKSSIIDKCVKCGCRFTTPEKPLKLLPCLHSMCLDCLTGKFPLKKREPKAQPKTDTAAPLASDSNTEAEAETPGKLETNITETSGTPTQDKTFEAGKTQDDRDEKNEEALGEAANEVKTDDSETENKDKENGTTSASENGSHPPERRVSSGSEGSKQNQAKTPGEANGESERSESHEEAAEEEMEPEDVKPQPATECPVCRDPIEHPCVGLMDNMFASLEPGSPSSPQEDVPHMCTACDEGQEAPFYCVQCEEWLCDSCVDAHRRVRITKDHTIIPKAEVNIAVNKSPWEQQMMCKQHRQEELKFFCERCEKLTCRDCQLMDHKDHKYQFLDQAADQYKQRLRGSLALMGEKRAKLASSREEINLKLKNCKEQKETLQQDILQQTDILVKGIRQAVWGVLANLASFTDAATKRLNKEIDDVSDLVGKFDHCIQFMEDILREGSSMSLLYSKGNVETKCRKVYHTQVDPQSLKGTLTIQYKHDVNWLLGNLSKIGAIFVNGVRYPPDKNGRPVGPGGGGGGGGGGSQQQQQPGGPGYQDNRPGMTTTSPHLQHMANQVSGKFAGALVFGGGRRGGGGGNGGGASGSGGGGQQPVGPGYQDNRPGMTTTRPHPQHTANQAIPGQRGPAEWNKYLQNVSKSGNLPAPPPNMTISSMMGPGGAGSLPPQLSLPSNRRGSGVPVGHPQWQGPPGIPNSTFPGHFVAGQLITPQQQNVQRPSFTPMRLHHRPATQNSFPGSNDHASASNMRSPPLYNRQGSEASGTSRSTHSTPDPARPASAGMYNDVNNSRPDSGGGPAMVDVKKERGDHSPDCVIMSSSIKSSDRSPYHSVHKHSETVLEMQRNLDEVLRAVPMDLSDNMEQISGSKPRTSVQRESIKSATPPSASTSLPVLDSTRLPNLIPAPTAGATSERNDTPQDTTARIPSPHHEAGLPSPSDQELRDNWQGGNSMPGFSLAQADSQGDPNDDYCACCHNGGDVLCCDRCPRVFHLKCHIPEIGEVPKGSFVCTICEGDNPVSIEESPSGKRKAPGGLTDAELKSCERILLDLFCHPSSVPFQEPVNRIQVPNYYKIITQPMDFTQIRCKLQRQHPNHYQSVKAYLWDLRQVFINCAIYNKAGSEVGKAGKIVRDLLEALVARLIPQYLGFVQENPSPCFSALQQKSLTEGTNGSDIGEGENELGASLPKRPRLDGE
ncbi:E3 ubiquitin-protein ligase TRIM33 [Elysia marginata]|uniref:E3 ubiquitin-protein ligase TRIM33 n=1 Tax=Elysia marginata TaxID=1093978 RepID=A0AAV4HI03_9GAST|nr:E3 ubiquitin-protein ligase TRIM33 [Elysia marginata]